MKYTFLDYLEFILAGILSIVCLVVTFYIICVFH